MVLPALLVMLLLTQAASSVCGAQCVEHQMPNHSAHSQAMMHCSMQREDNGTAVQSCPAASHAFCAIDLQANQLAKTVAPQPLYAELRADTLPAGASLVSFAPVFSALRSSPSATPLITALRV
jgi:hypothetical protein